MDNHFAIYLAPSSLKHHLWLTRTALAVPYCGLSKGAKWKLWKITDLCSAGFHFIWQSLYLVGVSTYFWSYSISLNFCLYRLLVKIVMCHI